MCNVIIYDAISVTLLFMVSCYVIPYLGIIGWIHKNIIHSFVKKTTLKGDFNWYSVSSLGIDQATSCDLSLKESKNELELVGH